jgi:hypothetical protein
MSESAEQLRGRLRALGLSDAAIGAAWPRWWSQDAESSPSARAELRFGIARRLGLDPGSLLEAGDAPRFLWRQEARFKHLSGESEREREGITSFGRAVAGVLLAGAPGREEPRGDLAAARAREVILASGRPFVALGDLLALSWAIGVPVAHLRVFPWARKRMAAMSVDVGGRAAVLLGRDSSFPAAIAFYLAHELGHIALGHLAADKQIVDLQDEEPAFARDNEEMEADAYALELLTGKPSLTVLTTGPGRVHGRSVAQAATAAAGELQIEPGTLALCFGYSTGDWRTANAALGEIYAPAQPVWQGVNAVAHEQLDLAELPGDAGDFLDAVLGEGAEES